MSLDIQYILQSTVSMLVITAPFSPVTMLFFEKATKTPPRNRVVAAGMVAMYVLLTLGITALAGKPLLMLLGVDLSVFGIMGGAVIVMMGIEMLVGGRTSKAQGQDERQAGPKANDTLFIPLTVPLLAGPGAIASAITVVAGRPGAVGLIAAIVSAGAVALAAFLSFTLLGRFIGKLRPSVVAIVARLGGLILTAIGVQMTLGGLKQFFG